MINIWRKVRIATMLGSGYGLLEHGALVSRGDRIDWLGPDRQLPQELLDQAAAVHDGDGRLLTPGLIDCHTHLVYGGNRASEFEQRLQGVSYADIARQGGGIVATVKATRAASDEELLAGALQRVDALQTEGVTTVEIKSGYGLDTETELKMLRVARRLERERALTVKTTFLGAHAIPPEFQGRADDYVDLICTEMLPAVAEQRLADGVDAFLDTIAFDPPQVERVFSKARQLGLAVKLHADQLNNTYGAVLAARFGALSADHLEYTDETGISAMQMANTVAVLLPGAFYTLGETQLPPVDLLREYDVPIALATDLNPGSSPLYSILLVMNMACTLFRLTSEESLAGVTRNAAKALGLGDEIGTLEVGKAADLVLWDVTEPAELAYRIGYNPCRQLVKGGKTILQR